MKAVLEIKPIKLPARSVHRIEGGKGVQITSVFGSVWVTQARDPRDIVLERGQSFILDRKGLTVVFALDDAAIIVGPAGHIMAADFDPQMLQGLVSAAPLQERIRGVCVRLGAWFRGYAGAAAKAALYEQLSRLSDAELERRGIPRGELHRCVFGGKDAQARGH
jgi:Protein of unknown function (DUF2917)